MHQLTSATPADLENVGVQALNDTTLQIRLNRPAAHFLTITSLSSKKPSWNRLTGKVLGEADLKPYLPLAGIQKPQRIPSTDISG